MPVRFWQEIQALLRRRDDTLAIWSTTSSTSLLPREYADGSRRAVMRKFPFVVVYTVEGDAAVITAIFHTSRNPVARDR